MKRLLFAALMMISGPLSAQGTRPPVYDFLGLLDTPDSYSGQAGKSIIVNPAATGLIFSSAGSGSVTSISALSPLFTTPDPITTTGILSFTATGISGNVLTSNGTTWVSLPLPAFEVPITFSMSLVRATNNVTLVGDAATPGNSRYYGTDGAGAKGWFALPAAGGVTSFNARTGAVVPLVGDYAAFYQPLDADLTFLAAVSPAPTTYGRGFLPLVDAGAGRTYLGLGTAAVADASSFEAQLTFDRSIIQSVEGAVVRLVGDVDLPGNSFYYGTNGIGTKGFFALPAAGGVTSFNARTGAVLPLAGDYASFYEVPLTFTQSVKRSTNTITLDGDSGTPGASKYYGTDSGSVKGWFALPAAGGDVTSITGTAPITVSPTTGAAVVSTSMTTDSILGRKTALTGVAEELSALPFPLTGDVTTTADSNVTAIGARKVTYPMMPLASSLSVLGRATNTPGDYAGIIVGAGSGAVLRENASTVGWGSIATAGITDAAVTYAKIQNVSASPRLLGRGNASAGDVEEIALGGGFTVTPGSPPSISVAGGGGGTVTDFSAGDLSPLFTTTEATTTTTPALSFALSNSAAYSWFGNATGGSAAPAYNITAFPAVLIPAFDGEVTKPSGSLTQTIADGITVANWTLTTPTIAAISNLTGNGFVKTGGGIGTLSVDTATYLTSSSISDTAYASSWDGVTTIAPSKNAIRDWGFIFDPDYDGKVEVLDLAAGLVKTSAGGVVSTAAAGTDYQAALGVTPTTVGLNFLDLANPTAIRFPKITAGNDVVAEDAATFRTSIGAAGGTGTANGTNTGDQTSIVGITGTTAQFNTALSDGDFATGGGTATGTNTGDQTLAGLGGQPLDSDLTALAAISGVQGDVIYHNGTSWVRLAAGTNGNQLTTHSTGANPSWDAPATGGGSVTLTGEVTGSGTGTFATTISDTVSVGDWTIADSTLTGATTANGSITVRGGTADSGRIHIMEDEDFGVNVVTLTAPALAANVTLTLPIDDGNADEFLSTNGAGVLDFVTVPTAGITNDAVTYQKLQNVSASPRLLGRATAAAGDAEEILLGANLSMDAGTKTLNASGGGGVAWGAITGTLSAQTDLQTALDGKEPALGNPSTNGYVLSSTTAGVRSWIAPAAGGGSGDVVGPASATDNAFAIFDTATGKLIRNSATTLTETAGNSNITFNGGAALIKTWTFGNQMDFWVQGTQYLRLDGGVASRFTSGAIVGWSSGTPDSAADTALARNAAGVVEVNNGTAGQYRDLKLRTVLASDGSYPGTPSLSFAGWTNSGLLPWPAVGAPIMISGGTPSMTWLSTDVRFVGPALWGGSGITGAMDVGIGRSAAGTLKVTDGGAGTGIITGNGTVPTGGSANQVLSKVDGTNYNVAWTTPTGGASDPRVVTITTSDATPDVDVDAYDAVTINGLSVAITSMSSGLTGSAANFQKLTYRLKDNGTARAITWGASFESSQSTLPTTTVTGKVTTVGLLYDSVKTAWQCIAVDVEDAALATVQTTSVNTAATSSTSHVMAGLNATLTPAVSGKVVFTVSGSLYNTSTGGITSQLRYGTGTAPTNGAADTGTFIGGVAARNTGWTANMTTPFSLTAIVTGLTLGTTYWFDASYSVTANTGVLYGVVVTAYEIP